MKNISKLIMGDPLIVVVFKLYGRSSGGERMISITTLVWLGIECENIRRTIVVALILVDIVMWR